MTEYSIPEAACPEDEVLRELELRLGSDRTYDGGRILGTMISGPHEFAKKVFAAHFGRNVGDPGVCPGTAELEQEAVRMMGALLNHPKAPGHVVSGGNEANILALWSARERMEGRGRKVIVPYTAHVSYEKAARLLGLKLCYVPHDKRFTMDIDAVKDAIDSETIALVGIAGSTDLGVIDPISELSALAIQHDLVLHVDAAFGGFVIPFLDELGWPSKAFDFELEGVSSMTIDPHKMGLAIQPAGAILYRHAEYMEPTRVDINYLAGGKTTQATLTGTRSGGAALSVWALMKHLGRSGYRRIVKDCLETTRYLMTNIDALPGISVVTPPTMNIVGMRPDHGDVPVFAEHLRRRGWVVSEFPTHVRIVLLPHVTRQILDRFLGDVQRSAEEKVLPATN